MTVALANTPVLETERLTLRAPVASDYPAWEAFAASDRARYLGGPHDSQAAWRAFGHFVGHWVMRGYGQFTVTLKGEDRPLGSVGPWFPGGWAETEIGWILWDAGIEGKGIAREAAIAARAYAFDSLGWTTAVSYIEPENARSIALAERLGARLDPQAPLSALHREIGALAYRHPKPESLT